MYFFKIHYNIRNKLQTINKHRFTCFPIFMFFMAKDGLQFVSLLCNIKYEIHIR